MKQMLIVIIATLFYSLASAHTPHNDVKHHHHHKWEYDSIQGLYSKQNCPGQYIEWIYQDDGTRIFLGCWGHKSHKSHKQFWLIPI